MRKLFSIISAFIIVLGVLILFGCNAIGNSEMLDDTSETTGIFYESTSEEESQDGCYHNWIEIKRNQPSCSKKGNVIYKCSGCQQEKTEILEKASHTEIIVEGLEPTCAKSGYSKSVRCSVCGYVIVAAEYIAATGKHNEVYVEQREATCTRNGHTDGIKCSTCGKYIEQPEVILASHDWETIPKIEHTCTEAGYEENQKCRRCGVFAEDPVEIPAAHTDVQVLYGFSATCTEPGLTDGICCFGCNEILYEQRVIEPLCHNYQIFDVYKSSCTSNGLTDGVKCVHCGDIKTAPQIKPATGHSFQNGACVYCGSMFTEGLKFIINPNDNNESTYLVGGFEIGYGDNIDTVVIPDTTPEGHEVVGIAESAFKGNEKISHVVLPPSITFIGSDAFDGCTNLHSIECNDISQMEKWNQDWHGDSRIKVTAVSYQNINFYDLYFNAMSDLGYNSDRFTLVTETYKYEGVSGSVLSYIYSKRMQNGDDHYLHTINTDTMDTSVCKELEVWYCDGYIYKLDCDNGKNNFKMKSCYEAYFAIASMQRLEELPTNRILSSKFYKDTYGKIYLEVIIDPTGMKMDGGNIDKLMYIYEFNESGSVMSFKYRAEVIQVTEDLYDNEEVEFIIESCYSFNDIGTLSTVCTIPTDIIWTDITKSDCELSGKDHVEVFVPEIAPSCFGQGYTECSYCAICLNVLKAFSGMTSEHDYIGGVCKNCATKAYE